MAETARPGDPPLVSIVIPNYNYAAYLEEAIASARAQTHPNVEIIVSDDGSTDASLEIARRHEGEGLSVLAEPNGGLSAARNRGIRAARGEYLIFLDADDRLWPEAVETALAHLEAHPDCLMVHGSMRGIDREGRHVRDYVQEPKPLRLADVFARGLPQPSNCVYRASAVAAAGPFDEGIRLCEDLDFLIRFLSLGDGWCHGRTTTDYRTHGAQLTRRPAELVTNALRILDRHRAAMEPVVGRDAVAAARRYYRRHWGGYVLPETARALRRGAPGHALWTAGVFLRLLPDSLAGTLALLRRKAGRRA